MRNSISAWTDYPFTFLGDTEGQVAPVREIEVLTYDRNKYVEIRVAGRIRSIKAGYCYSQPGRVGEVSPLTYRQLEALPRTIEGDTNGR